VSGGPVAVESFFTKRNNRHLKRWFAEYAYGYGQYLFVARY
jgi:hypothetical protein